MRRVPGYEALKHDIPLMIANALTLSLAAAIILFAILHKKVLLLASGIIQAETLPN